MEPRGLVTRVSEVRSPQWQTHQTLRIAVLTDLHTGSPFNGVSKLRRIVQRTNIVQPDLIVLLGDFVIQGVIGGHTVPPQTIAAELANLRAPLGVYAVLGNHDHWFNARAVAGALSAVGIVLLEDRAVRITANGQPFWLAGVSDYWEGRHDLAAALNQVSDTSPVILITHNPDIFPSVPSSVALTLAGHTHGGQVYLPLLGRPIVPSRYGSRFAAGLVVEDGKVLYVSTGLGTSIIPVRFRVPPEITILNLTH